MKYILSLIICFTVNSASAQHFAVSATRTNVLYVGVDNPISIAVENYPGKQVIVKASSGEVFGASSLRVYRCNTPGTTTISLYKSDLSEIGSMNFRVKYIPDPVVKLGTVTSGNTSKSSLVSQQYLRAEIDNFDYDVRFTIKSFTFNMISKSGGYFKEFNITGNRFSKEIIKSLNRLKKKDLVIFKNISAIGPDGRVLELAPVLLTIID